MRRKEKEITDKELILKILKGSKVCRLALNDTEVPYIIPLDYGYIEDALYFHSATKGTKLDLIRKDNRAAFEIEYYSEILKSDISCEWTTKYRSVIGRGEIETFDSLEDKRKGLEIIMQHNGKYNNHFEDKMLKRVAVYRLKITELKAKQSGNW